MEMKIKVPQARKAKIMLWTHVSYHDMEEIDKSQSTPDLESVLCSVFGVDLPEPKRGVLLELYVQTVIFCREQSFSKEQTSALLSVIKSIHEVNIETPLNNIEQCFTYCKELLLCHSVRRPPFSINLFSCEEAECILKYIHNSYIRHYKLYKYIFTPQVKLDLSLTYTVMKDSGPDIENMSEKEAPKTDMSSETSITEHEEATVCSTSKLKALIEREVGQQMMLVSGQLDQKMKEIAVPQNNDSSQPKQKVKK
ncbi:cilia- and flagella-associated protein 119 [Embiotoca jacksoni]|uniref:cilia- and flagella-associated protein 119 n=1 Tax=Embiotoca jacksoni TaxID=100190 RepID=UPI0037049C33